MKKMTAKQYAQLRGVSPAAVSKAMKYGWRLPGVKSVTSYGRFYVLNVNEKEAIRNNDAKINLAECLVNSS